MLSVIIPTRNAEETLGRTLACLVPATVAGLVREVIIADGGSTDDTEAIAEETGARFVSAPRGRGTQLSAGAAVARGPWLLFLHGDTVLDPGWAVEAEAFMARAEQEAGPSSQATKAAVFRFALDDFSTAARWVERFVWLRCALFALPYGDQGLLIPERFYRALGGFRDLPLMEDVDLVRRIGRKRLAFLRTPAVTSARRYRREGYWRRGLRNLTCLTLHSLRVPARVIARIYQ